ncbi:hypothetical protein PO124_01550 [Bacillus licheniformis]|nr:hypothetical protein [Bacillus licheniformis]
MGHGTHVTGTMVGSEAGGKTRSVSRRRRMERCQGLSEDGGDENPFGCRRMDFGPERCERKAHPERLPMSSTTLGQGNADSMNGIWILSKLGGQLISSLHLQRAMSANSNRADRVQLKPVQLSAIFRDWRS